jgi:hypothetical protein
MKSGKPLLPGKRDTKDIPYNMNQNQLIIIENLTVPVVMSTLLGILLKPSAGRAIYYVDATPAGKSLAQILAGLFGATMTYLEFNFMDVRDDNGYLIRLRVPYQDVDILRKKIFKDPLFQAVFKDPTVSQSGLQHYFKKQFLAFHFVLYPDSILRVMALTHIGVWKNKQQTNPASSVVLYARPRLWFDYLIEYSKEQGVSLQKTIPQMFSLKKAIIHMLGKNRLKFWWYLWQRRGKPHLPLPDGGVKLTVDYHGHLNLDPHLHSDLFFLQPGTVDPKDVLMNFSIAQDPLDDKKLLELRKYGIKAVGLTPKATQSNEAPFFNHWPTGRIPRLGTETLQGSDRNAEKAWFKKECETYFEQYHYWRDYFLKTHTRIYSTWYKYDTSHMIMTDALRSVGGVLSVYQRAFEEVVRPETALWADVVFGFSKEGIELEEKSLSEIPYYVITGYVGDYRFEAIKPTAMEVRNRLLSHGAKRILAYFDENSNDNARWHTGHKPMRENYSFLLEKVLQDPQLGLVIKPKTPRTLRRRLAHVSDLLAKAEATGRCFVFEGGSLQGAYPPAVAALASDFAIHGHLDTATAGFESALAGVPTLLLDREGWPTSKLHGLGPLVAFKNWDELWMACQDHWKRPQGTPGFGDWSSMIHEMDPFRDGKAAYRIGSYFQWLLEGFKNRWEREQVLEYAAKQYCNQWGKDKIVSINC